MESIEENNLLEQTKQIYDYQKIVSEIDSEQALQIGRELTAREYRMIGATVIRAGSLDNVGQLLEQIDHSRKYRRALEADPDKLIGPYYMKSKESEFCPEGIGIWVPPVNER